MGVRAVICREGRRAPMKKLLVVSLVLGLLTFCSSAAAGGWAGSRYSKSDCTYSQETNTVFCEARFTDEIFTTVGMTVVDEQCQTGLRLIERTGWLVITYRGWGLFSGHVPVHHKEIAGNEDSFEETWRDYTDLDLGCLV